MKPSDIEKTRAGVARTIVDGLYSRASNYFFGMTPDPNLIWVTNHPKPIESFWPRRVGVKYIVGPPKEVENMNPEHIGIYTDDPLHREKPLARNPKEMKEIQKL